MFRFARNFQSMFMLNWAFCQSQSQITDDVILTSYLPLKHIACLR